jgi:TolA-binding protein
MVRQTEENGNRLRSIETGMTQLKSEQDQKIQALEQRLSEAAAAAAAAAAPAPTEAAPAATTTTPPKAKPKTSSKPPKTAEAMPAPAPASASESGDEASETAAATDPGEDAYSQGFHQWEAGQYDEAISTLKSFVSDYPKHRRVSYANNLIGRALLDKGDARAAATALLSNYRGNPGGERAPDSLYYLGQALSKLGQSTQACRAYDELDAVYGAKIRPDLKKLETDAKAQDKCS